MTSSSLSKNTHSKRIPLYRPPFKILQKLNSHIWRMTKSWGVESSWIWHPHWQWRQHCWLLLAGGGGEDSPGKMGSSRLAWAMTKLYTIQELHADRCHLERAIDRRESRYSTYFIYIYSSELSSSKEYC